MYFLEKNYFGQKSLLPSGIEPGPEDPKKIFFQKKIFCCHSNPGNFWSNFAKKLFQNSVILNCRHIRVKTFLNNDCSAFYIPSPNPFLLLLEAPNSPIFHPLPIFDTRNPKIITFLQSELRRQKYFQNKKILRNF